MKIEIVRFKMLNKGSSLALVTLKVIPWGNVVVDGVTLFKSDSKRWTTFPSRKDTKEENKWWPYIRFESKDSKDNFDREVFKAFDEKMANESSQSNEGFPDFL